MEENENLSIHTGFPNPATDDNIISLDITKILIKHPASTFFMTIEGYSWERIGVFNNDLVIIDRSLDPKPQDMVVYWRNNDFSISRFSKISEEVSMWGVVTGIVHRYRL